MTDWRKWLANGLLLAWIGLAVGCTAVADKPELQSAKTFPVITQVTFDDYRLQTRQWLTEHRLFLSEDPAAEVEANSPQEWRPTSKPKKGILLVHGLGDSPYSFTDIGPVLAENGFLVRTLLLSGHGTRPGDMLNVQIDQWRALLKKQTKILEQEVDQVYLGGFSTGANLVTELALQDERIAGLVLFSPAFESNAPIDWLAPWVQGMMPWLRTDMKYRHDIYVRYGNMPTNGFSQYYYSSEAVLKALSEKTFDKPTLVVVSEADSVVDVQRVLALFGTRFTNPNSRLIWYGAPSETEDARVLVRSASLPEWRISNFSHMGMVFSPDNPLYGINGQFRMCWNGQSDAHYQQCENGEEVWYSAWGYETEDKAHARLTFNPYFAWQNDVMLKVLASGSVVPKP